MDAEIKFIGRKKERETLLSLLENREPEMVVSASGLVRNNQSQLVVDSVVELEDLFEAG